MMSEPIRFGAFLLDAKSGRLSREGTPLKLGGRAFDILCELARAHGNLVTKEHLMARVWPDLTVADSNIQVQISKLRKLLWSGDETNGHVVTVPGRGYRLIGIKDETSTHSRSDAAPRVPHDRSIVVLPFANLSDEREQEYFADGIVEEVIIALSRMRWLLVIAHNSSVTYRGRTTPVGAISRELGVRYVLQGSVRKAANRVRVTGQLIDAATGAHLWADRFEGQLEDVFHLQDQIAERVVAAVAPTLERAEIERAKLKPTANLDAYDYFLRGLAEAYKGTVAGIAEAQRMFHCAIELDPDFARAYGMAAWCHVWRRINGLTIDRAAEVAETIRLAGHVRESGRDDAVALSFGGLGLAYIAGDLQTGLAMIDRALRLNPSLAVAWISSGCVRAFLGQSEITIEHLEHAIRLSPVDPHMFTIQTTIASAHFMADRYDLASLAAGHALREQPNFLGAIRILAACSALSGRPEEARKAIGIAEAIDPKLRISNLRDRVGPFRNEYFSKLTKGLRLAGLPE